MDLLADLPNNVPRDFDGIVKLVHDFEYVPDVTPFSSWTSPVTVAMGKWIWK